MFLSCRGAVIGAMRKTTGNKAKQHSVEQFRETCAVLLQKPIQVLVLDLVCPRVLLETATANFFFLEKIETTRDHDPHNQHFLVLDITIYSTYSTNYDSEADSSPRCILSLSR